MLSLVTVREIICAVNNAKDYKDYATANRGFIGLLYAVLNGLVESGCSLIFQEGSHPYYDVIVIAVGHERIRIPRPLLALKPFEQYYDLSIDEDRPKEPQKRPDYEYQDCSSSIDVFGLTVPEGWLLEDNARSEQWMSADDISNFGYWDYANRKPAFYDSQDEDDIDEEVDE